MCRHASNNVTIQCYIQQLYILDYYYYLRLMASFLGEQGTDSSASVGSSSFTCSRRQSLRISETGFHGQTSSVSMSCVKEPNGIQIINSKPVAWPQCFLHPL